MAVLLGSIGASNKIVIDKFNYFGELPDENYNGKVIYYKNDKLYYATVYVDLFHKRIYFDKQPKGAKVYKGLYEQLYKFIFKK
jgi:hypothetical protein